MALGPLGRILGISALFILIASPFFAPEILQLGGTMLLFIFFMSLAALYFRM